MPAVRLPVVDGLFYRAAPAALRAQVADCLAAVGADDSDAERLPPKLLITPHAGYEYCGHAALIERDWNEVLRCDLDTSGACPHCGAAIAGRFGEFKRGFGRRRMPVRLAVRMAAA